KSPGDLVRIRVQEPDPSQIINSGKLFEQHWKAVFQSKIFAVARRVLPNQRDLADPRPCQPLGFRHDRLESPGPEFPAQLRNYAEAAWMIAALGDLDVCHVARRSQNARSGLVIEVVR